MKLLLNAVIKFATGLIMVGLLLFWPAGSFLYTNGWIFIGLLFVPMLLLGATLFIKAPELLEKRLNTKEKEKTQKGVVALSALAFLAGFILAGLDYCLGWSVVPGWLVIAASVLLLVSYGLYVEVMRENAWLSRTVEVQEGQKVVDSGLYGIVRHPMYMATIFLFMSIPLVLGSWISCAVFLHYPLIIILRIGNEEELLERELEGYGEYKKKVKYRLLPFIW